MTKRYNTKRYNTKRYNTKRKKWRYIRARCYVIVAIVAVILLIGMLYVKAISNDRLRATEISEESHKASASKLSSMSAERSLSLSSLPADLKPSATAKTNPMNFGFETNIMVGDTEVDSYQRDNTINFGTGDEYTNIEGVTTFRGNNYRNLASWGTAEITDEKLTVVSTMQNGAIGSWGGYAWTGQPLVIRWPDDVRDKMTSLYEEFRGKDGFTEVIASGLDGYIYFQELGTDKRTRDPINVGAPIKGTSTLDPRGYPILYVGQGVGPQGGTTDDHMYFRAFSLTDGTLLHQWGYDDGDPFAYRHWQAYDSSPLISAETDTLIEPGENGVLYTVKLNTSYDAGTGTVSMNPDPVVKYRYTSQMNTSRDTDNGGRWGVEDSIVAWGNYIIFTDNAGVLQCVNINTMEPVYVNDLGNDSDVSMTLEEDLKNNTFYLYSGSEYDDEAVNTDPGQGTCYAYKINGLTGEIIWKAPFTVDSSNSKVDGGILSSPVLGKTGTTLEGLIVYTVTAEVKNGSTTSRVVALNKETGREVWSYDMDVAEWSPSSPVPIYTADGQGYIVQCDWNGDVALLKADGQACKEVYKLQLKVDILGIVLKHNNFEATPVIYGNMVIVGSRSRNLFFIKIS